MKGWIFKGLAYLATCGAAAATVLLTASSVGLKKSVTETFPNLSGLIQDRPDVKEDLLEPIIPPEPPDPAGGGGEKKDQDQTDEGDDQKGDKGNDQGNDQGDNPDPSVQSNGDAAQGGGGPSGAAGGVGSAGGSMACESLDQLITAIKGVTHSLVTMPDQAQSITACGAELLTKKPAAGPGSPGPSGPQLPSAGD